MSKDADIHNRDTRMARLEASFSRMILDARLTGPEALVVLTNLAGQVARETTRMERQEVQEALETPWDKEDASRGKLLEPDPVPEEEAQRLEDLRRLSSYPPPTI